MKKRRILILLVMAAMIVMSVSSAYAYTNMDFSFSFVERRDDHLFTDPNQKTDDERKIYVTCTSGTISTITPVFFAAYKTNDYTYPVTYDKYTTTLSRQTIDYTLSPILNAWYQLRGRAGGAEVNVSGRWCP